MSKIAFAARKKRRIPLGISQRKSYPGKKVKISDCFN
jgi:hypothetical protein